MKIEREAGDEEMEEWGETEGGIEEMQKEEEKKTLKGRKLKIIDVTKCDMTHLP